MRYADWMSDITSAPTILWFRTDLRLSDHPALHHAAARSAPLLCVYVVETNPAFRPLGGACLWWLQNSLSRLSQDLARLGQRLLILTGDSETLIPALASATGADAVFWNRRYGKAEQDSDTRIKATLRAAGVTVTSFNSHLLNEPWEVATQAGTPVKVFTPYWRAARARGEPRAPLPTLKALPQPAPIPDDPRFGAMQPEALGFDPPQPDWAAGMRVAWQPGEAGARTLLARFLDQAVAGYGDNRNRPDLPATSRLSPHLRFGEISPYQIWHATQAAILADPDNAPEGDAAKFLSEVGWREFAYHLLHFNPELDSRNFNPNFDSFPWRSNPELLAAWQKGQTGYPVVDAGMRELWTTGWMHNRVRMIVASFLVKHLLIDWREGEKWFWDTLVDADPANNPASWQWVAGSGADAAPYFRIFNPISQGEKFDPNGEYTRKWVPELARLPTELLFAPWEAPEGLLLAHGVRLGHSYPRPIVDHAQARDVALAAYAQTKVTSAG
jgi:deoxyribodipyrimidine photo-lyase